MLKKSKRKINEKKKWETKKREKKVNLDERKNLPEQIKSENDKCRRKQTVKCKERESDRKGKW